MTCRTVTEAAQVVGISRKTGERYLRDPTVKEALAEAQDTALRDTTRRLQTGMWAVLDTLEAIHTNDEAPASVRVSAARAWGDMALRYGEYEDLLGRIEALEARIGH